MRRNTTIIAIAVLSFAFLLSLTASANAGEFGGCAYSKALSVAEAQPVDTSKTLVVAQTESRGAAKNNTEAARNSNQPITVKKNSVNLDAAKK